MSDETFLKIMPLATQSSPNLNLPSDNEHRKLKKACSDFESLFINNLFKEMRASVPKDGLIGGGKAEEMFASMLDQQVAQKIAENRGIGISSALFEKLRSNLNDDENKDRD